MRSFVVCEHDPSLRIAKHFFGSGFNALSEFCRRCQYRRMKSIPLERWQMACAVVLLACASAGAQTSTAIENFTPIAAARLVNGLGWNVTPGNEWEFEKVRAAGGREARDRADDRGGLRRAAREARGADGRARRAGWIVRDPGGRRARVDQAAVLS